MLVVLAMPFLGKWRLGHRFNLGLLWSLLGGVALLTANVKGHSADPSICGTCSHDRVGAGIAAGLGVEYGFAPNWSAKAEYMWIGGVSGALTTDKINEMRVGLNYRFGGAKN